MKTIYILLTRSGTLLSNLVYAVTGANYTHASLAFDEDLGCLYSSTRKNGYTMFPAGPSREYLNRGVFRLRENVPCALYALEVTDEAYARARRRADQFRFLQFFLRFLHLFLHFLRLLHQILHLSSAAVAAAESAFIHVSNLRYFVFSLSYAT